MYIYGWIYLGIIGVCPCSNKVFNIQGLLVGHGMRERVFLRTWCIIQGNQVAWLGAYPMAARSLGYGLE